MGAYLTNPTAMRWLAILTTALALLLTMAGVLLADAPRRGGCPCLADRTAASTAAPELKRAAAEYHAALDRAAARYKESVGTARTAYLHVLEQIETDNRRAIASEVTRLKNLRAPRVEPEPNPNPEADAMNRRTVNVELQVPNPRWSIAIRQVRRVNDELWVVSDLSKQDGMAAMVITTVSDSVTVAAPESWSVRHFVTGRTWRWDNDDAVAFIDSVEALGEPWRAGKPVMIGPADP